MDDVFCVGIKADGQRCASRKNAAVGDGSRCRTHYNTTVKHGLYHTMIKEMRYKLRHDIHLLPHPGLTHMEHAIQLEEATRIRINALIADHREAYDAETQLIANAREVRLAEREERHRQRMEAFNQRLADIRARFAVFDENENQVVAEPPAQPHGGELGRFANDRQNVHTRQVIVQNNEVINKLREIPVPSEYKWNLTSCSKTPFEVGLECNLTPDATMNMVTNYCGKAYLGTEVDTKQYGEVLDGMWQFVKNSPHKDDLCKIIKTELQDGVGMCAMGNISRVCNILAGYMDGFTQTESLSEKLGGLFSKLMEITDVNERMRQATKILRENQVPRDQWTAWTDPLAE